MPQSVQPFGTAVAFISTDTVTEVGAATGAVIASGRQRGSPTGAVTVRATALASGFTAATGVVVIFLCLKVRYNCKLNRVQ